MEHHPVYRAKTFNLSGLAGISDKTLEMHFKLYEGYVQQTNLLNERIAGFLRDGKIDQEEMPAYSELTRRLGFEYSGMVNHEYYFENLTGGAQGEPPSGGKLRKAIESAFGKYETWLADFRAVATMPGVGWAMLFQDPSTGFLSNHFVQLHQDNVPVGFKPILVMDGWEHAFMRDYLATERAKYVDAFFKNVNWEAVDKRIA